MKKHLSILMLFLVGMVFGVAANSSRSRPGSDYDVGTTKVEASASVDMTVNAYINEDIVFVGVEMASVSYPAMQNVNVIYAIVKPVEQAIPPLLDERLCIDTSRGLIKEKIHILNCSVRQCSPA